MYYLCGMKLLALHVSRLKDVLVEDDAGIFSLLEDPANAGRLLTYLYGPDHGGSVMIRSFSWLQNYKTCDRNSSGVFLLQPDGEHILYMCGFCSTTWFGGI